MTVEKLIEKLQSMPQSAVVLTYVEEAEEYGQTSKVEMVTSQDDMPYAKGDKPDVGEGRVLIKGWIAS